MTLSEAEELLNTPLYAVDSEGEAFVNAALQDDTIYIYSADLRQCLTTHEVTWSKYDRYCKDQFVALEQPEEFPTMPVKSSIQMLKPPEPSTSFEKFNFDKGVKWDD